MRQRRWIELLKNSDFKILYHPGKNNVIVNAFGRKSIDMLAHLMVSECRVIGVVQQIRLQDLKRVICLTHLTVQPELIQRILVKCDVSVWLVSD